MCDSGVPKAFRPEYNHFVDEAIKPSSQRLYRIVGIRSDRSEAVIMTGMELEQANAARDVMANGAEFVWVKVERE